MRRFVIIGIFLFVGISIYFVQTRKDERKNSNRAVDTIEISNVADVPDYETKPEAVTAQQAIDDEESFQAQIQRTWNAIPLRNELKSLDPKEVHSTPKRIVDAGFAIGELVEKIKKDPILTPLAVDFFKNCAENSDFANSVRAVCYSDFLTFAKGSKLIEEVSVPVSIQAMAKELQGFKP